MGNTKAKAECFSGETVLEDQGVSAEMSRLAHQSGKVLFLSRPMRFLLMVVEHGTASRWWELLGRVGTH